MDSAVAALLGAGIGTLGGWVSTYLALRAENRRQLRQLAIDACFKEWETHTRLAKQGGVLPPLAYLQLNSGMIKLMERDDFTQKAVHEMYKDQVEFTRAILQEDEVFRKAMAQAKGV